MIHLYRYHLPTHEPCDSSSIGHIFEEKSAYTDFRLVGLRRANLAFSRSDVILRKGGAYAHT